MVGAEGGISLPRRVRRVVGAGGVTLIVILGQLSAATPDALARCDPGRASNGLTYYYDGQEEAVPNGKDAGGLSATIENYDPFVYNTSGFLDSSQQWIMETQSSLDHYVQVGWTEDYSGTRNTFVERGISSTKQFTDWYFSPYDINANIPYEIDFDPNGGTGDQYSFSADGSQLLTIYDTGLPNPNYVQDYAEIETKASQMPGGYNNTDTSSNAQVRYDGSWHSLDAPTSNPPSFAGILPSPGTNTDHYQIWDNACAT